MKKTLMFVIKYIVPKIISNLLLKFVRSFNGRNTNLIGHFFGRAPFKKTSFKKSYLGLSRNIKFDSLILPVPEHVEKYLTVRYGENYMKLPSDEEKMKYPSHSFIVDTRKSYTEYMNNKESL